MRTGYAYILLSFLFHLIPYVRACFSLKDSYVGQDFFDRWDWETFDDPTHGRVNYVDQTTATQRNLSYGMFYSLHCCKWNQMKCGTSQSRTQNS